MIDIRVMKCLKCLSISLFVLLLIVAIVLVALPCVTHPVQVVNRHAGDVSIRLSSGKTELWTGVLKRAEMRNLPVATNEGWEDLTLEATELGGTKIGSDSLYVLRHPMNTRMNFFVIGKDGVYAFYMDHPLEALFQTETIHIPLDLVLMAANVLRCLDCPEVRVR